MFEKYRQVIEESQQDWKFNEVFSLGWFVMLGVLIIVYAIWLKLVDRRKGVPLLLIGALSAVAYSLNSLILGDILGLAEYKIRLFPFSTAVFLSSITLAPIIIMLVQQHTSSWKGYLLWSGIGFAFLNFAVFPVYMDLGIFVFHNWNVFYHFLVTYSISICVRFVFRWIIGRQERAV